MKKENKIVGVIGLGYVGLPLAMRCQEQNFDVIGFDLDKKKIDSIKKGRSPFKEEFIEERKHLLKEISSTTSPAMLKKADVVLICVPTPVDEQFFPDLTPVKSAVEIVIKNHKKVIITRMKIAFDLRAMDGASRYRGIGVGHLLPKRQGKGGGGRIYEGGNGW